MATSFNIFPSPCPCLTFHCSIFLCQCSLSPFSACFSAFIFSLSLSNCIFSHFSSFYPSPIYILSLPLLFFCPPQPLNKPYPSAVMACVQRTQLAKPRASAEIHERSWHSFTGCVCVCVCLMHKLHVLRLHACVSGGIDRCCIRRLNHVFMNECVA